MILFSKDAINCCHFELPIHKKKIHHQKISTKIAVFNNDNKKSFLSIKSVYKNDL